MALTVEILANPSSGRGRGPDKAARIAELLSARGHEVGTFAGTSRAEAIAWAGRAAELADRLVVVGGDGTLNAVLDGLPAEAPPLPYRYGFGIDAAVGLIREELEAQGVADNTVIIFMSDNGYFRNSKGFGDKVYAYEEGARTPMLVYDPRVPASHGESCGAVVGNIDIVPTMLDLAGVDYHVEYDKNRPEGDRG